MQHSIEANKALEKSKERFRNAFLTSFDAVAIIRLRDRKYIDINEMFCRLTKYSQQEIVGVSFHKISLLQNEGREEKFFTDIEKKGSILNQVTRIKIRDGMIKSALVSAMIMPLDSEQHMLLVIRNIDDLQKARKALETSEARFRELFNNMSSGVMVLQSIDDGNDFVLVDMNRAAEKIEGISKEKIVGKSVLVSLPWVGRFGLGEIYKRVWKTGEPVHHPVSIYKDDKLKVWKENYVYKLSSGELIDVYDDITKRKKAEEKLLEYQEKLQSLTSELSLVEARERRSFANDLHDHIGQTLSVITMKCHSLREKLNSSSLTSELDEISDLIQMAITSTRSLTFELSPPVLFELGLESALEWLAEDIHKQHGLPVQLISDKRPKAIDEDLSILIFRSVRELLANIIKHADASMARIGLRVSNSLVHITVEDDGKGFDPEILSRKFPAENCFGLFNIRERMHNLGGKLKIYSKIGGGTRMVLAIPLGKEHD